LASSFGRFVADEQGATAIEYGLIAAGIAAAIIATVSALGTNVNAAFSSVSSQLKWATPNCNERSTSVRHDR
jgi:pilus assembly protein Flp/PilA